jgi:hypothetical protein
MPLPPRPSTCTPWLHLSVLFATAFQCFLHTSRHNHNADISPSSPSAGLGESRKSSIVKQMKIIQVYRNLVDSVQETVLVMRKSIDCETPSNRISGLSCYFFIFGRGLVWRVFRYRISHPFVSMFSNFPTILPLSFDHSCYLRLLLLFRVYLSFLICQHGISSYRLPPP